MSCVFCRIASGEIPAQIVAQEDGTTAFLDVTPLADGHLLVIPSTHTARLEDLEPGQVDTLFRTVARLAGVVRDAVGADGTTIGINNGEATGQTVPHVHIHIVPRRKGDGAGSVHTLFPAGPRRDVTLVGDAIRAALASR